VHFLHFHVSPNYFPSQQLATQLLDGRTERPRSVARSIRRATGQGADREHGNAPDEKFALHRSNARHLARLEFPRTKVNALPKMASPARRGITSGRISIAASACQISPRSPVCPACTLQRSSAATGYHPREYLLHQRIEHAKSLLSDTEMPLAEVALTVGFCTQAHFSTVFKRMTGETPARWRCASKNALPSIQCIPQGSSFVRQKLELCSLGEAA
jgi:hypothetical protein